MVDQPATPCCATCGARLATDTGQSWCPSCAWAAVLTQPGGAGKSPAGVLFKVPGHAVLTELGRGATGIVYRARQDNPARDVALKILRPHEAGSVESRTRFRLEGAALAELDHPVILPVFSVGEHDGLPYFTMKLCEGGTLAQRLDRFRGHWRAGAELLAILADGVHYAHSRGVLHRDLKPGNVLFDEADRAFVSDFGLAKLINPGAASGLVTRPLVVMGTPGYVAPEVLAGGAGAATTAADVFALGAILHELLTGLPPAATGETKALPHGVPLDLAVICSHSLRAEPAARYHSAEALAEDLRAWLAGRPIAARPRSAVGRVWAWATRNPILAGVSLAAALLLVTVAWVATAAAMRLRQEQRATTAALAQVRTEAAISQAVREFLQNDLLAQASPDQQPDRNLTLRSVLDRAAGRIDGRFPDQPLMEAALRETVGTTYGSLGEYRLMQEQLERAHHLLQGTVGSVDRRTLAVGSLLADALRRQARYAEAEHLARRTWTEQQRTLGPRHTDALLTGGTLARIHREQGRLAESEAVFLRVVAAQRQAHGPEHTGTLATMRELAWVYVDERKFAAAEALAAETLAVQQRALGPEHPDTLRTMETLGGILVWEQKWAEAESLLSRALALDTRILGPDHPDTVAVMVWLGSLYTGLEKYAKAEQFQFAAMEARRRVLGAEHPLTLESRNYIGALFICEERYAEAEEFLAQTVEIKIRVLGAEHPDTLGDEYHLGLARLHTGQFAQAEKLARALLATDERVLGPDHQETRDTKKVLARALEFQGRFDEARGLLEQVWERSRQLRGANHSRTLDLAIALAFLQQHSGCLAEAEALLVETLPAMKKLLGPEHRQTLEAEDLLNLVWFKEGKLAEAEAGCRRSLAIRDRLFPGEWRTAGLRGLLGEVLAAEGRTTEAEPWLLAGYAGLVEQSTRISALSQLSPARMAGKLAAFYTASGRPAEAARWHQRSVATDP